MSTTSAYIRYLGSGWSYIVVTSHGGDREVPFHIEISTDGKNWSKPWTTQYHTNTLAVGLMSGQCGVRVCLESPCEISYSGTRDGQSVEGVIGAPKKANIEEHGNYIDSFKDIRNMAMASVYMPGAVDPAATVHNIQCDVDGMVYATLKQSEIDKIVAGMRDSMSALIKAELAAREESQMSSNCTYGYEIIVPEKVVDNKDGTFTRAREAAVVVHVESKLFKKTPTREQLLLEHKDQILDYVGAEEISEVVVNVRPFC